LPALVGSDIVSARKSAPRQGGASAPYSLKAQGEIMRLIASIFLMTLGLQGCAYFTKPLEQPVIEEKLNPAWLSRATVGTLSLTPERRVVLVNFRNNRFCAEAPTEIGMDLASTLRASLAGQTDTAKIEAAIESALSSHNSVMNKRTQGMQLFLANAYFTCQMYMNGGIDERQLLEMQFQTLQIVQPLISAELTFMYQKGGPDKNGAKASPTAESSEVIKSNASRTTTEILNKKSAKPDEAPKPSSPEQQ
jgi:hypothetical protein